MPGILDDEEIAQIRADVAEVACDLPCTIQRGTGTSEPQGGETLPDPSTWPVISPNGFLAGLANPSASTLQNYGFTDGSLSIGQINFQWGTDVQKEDRITLDGEKFRALMEITPQSYSALTVMLAARVK